MVEVFLAKQPQDPLQTGLSSAKTRGEVIHFENTAPVWDTDLTQATWLYHFRCQVLGLFHLVGSQGCRV